MCGSASGSDESVAFGIGLKVQFRDRGALDDNVAASVCIGLRKVADSPFQGGSERVGGDSADFRYGYLGSCYLVRGFGQFLEFIFAEYTVRVCIDAFEELAIGLR